MEVFYDPKYNEFSVWQRNKKIKVVSARNNKLTYCTGLSYYRPKRLIRIGKFDYYNWKKQQ